MSHYLFVFCLWNINGILCEENNLQQEMETSLPPPNEDSQWRKKIVKKYHLQQLQLTKLLFICLNYFLLILDRITFRGWVQCSQCGCCQDMMCFDLKPSCPGPPRNFIHLALSSVDALTIVCVHRECPKIATLNPHIRAIHTWGCTCGETVYSWWKPGSCCVREYLACFHNFHSLSASACYPR